MNPQEDKGKDVKFEEQKNETQEYMTSNGFRVTVKPMLREMDGSMKASVLNVVLVHLVIDDKITINDDNSLTWIYAENNKKLEKSWRRATPL